MLDVLDSPTRLAQEAERRRIARELHDGVVQSLIALIADLEYFRTRCLPTIGQTSHEFAEKVETWQELARESLTSMRQALGSLRKPSELDLGLEYAIQIMLAKLRDVGYSIVFECDDWPDVLPLEYVSNIYYIVREALTNIYKHAKASSIKVSMFSFEGQLHLSVADDGIGMTSQSVAAYACNGYHQGLIGLQERVVLLNGQHTIESMQGRGTRLDVAIPYCYR